MLISTLKMFIEKTEPIILRLPLEIKIKIISYLNYNDIRLFTSSCKKLYLLRKAIDIPLICIPKCTKLFRKDASGYNLVFNNTRVISPGRVFESLINQFRSVKYISFEQSARTRRIMHRQPTTLLKRIQTEHLKGITLDEWITGVRAFDRVSLDDMCPNLTCVVIANSFCGGDDTLTNMFKKTSSWNQLKILTISSWIEPDILCRILNKCIGLKFLDIQKVYCLGYPEDVLDAIVTHCKKLKVLKLPMDVGNSNWARVLTRYMNSSLELDVLEARLDYHFGSKLNEMPSTGNNILHHLTHLISYPISDNWHGNISNIAQDWILKNLSNNLIMFDCEWFILTEKNLCMLSESCPNLKSLSATCGCNEFSGTFLKEIATNFPSLYNLQLILFQKGYLDKQILVQKSNIHKGGDDFLETLGLFKNLESLDLFPILSTFTFTNYEQVSLFEKKIRQMGIRFQKKFFNSVKNNHTHHLSWFNKKI